MAEERKADSTLSSVSVLVGFGSIFVAELPVLAFDKALQEEKALALCSLRRQPNRVTFQDG